MRDTRVVITGVGVVSPLGRALAPLWDALLAGRTAVRDWEDLRADGYRSSMACRIDDFPGDPLRRGADLTIAAVEQAVSMARVTPPRTAGVFVGSTLGESAAFEYAGGGADLDVADYGIASFARAIAQRYGLHGPRQSLATACAAGNCAVGAAMEALRTGRVPLALAGGVEPFSRLALVGFSRSRATAADRCRPFDRRRSGITIGEGAAVFVLERAGDALARGVEPLVEVVSLGLSCDAHHPTAPLPDGSGMHRSMHSALAAAGIAPADVAWVNTHGSGTRASDAAEGKALHALFGRRMPAISGSKGALGHALGAASALELAICVEGLRKQTVPPTAGYEEHDPDCVVECTSAPVQREMRLALNNAFAFGGVNSALLLRAWQH